MALFKINYIKFEIYFLDIYIFVTSIVHNFISSNFRNCLRYSVIMHFYGYKMSTLHLMNSCEAIWHQILYEALTGVQLVALDNRWLKGPGLNPGNKTDAYVLMTFMALRLCINTFMVTFKALIFMPHMIMFIMHLMLL